jgi:hypothetical protein
LKKVRVTSATLKRLAMLGIRDAAKRANQQWPPMLDADTWTALAMPMQAALCADTQADAPRAGKDR